MGLCINTDKTESQLIASNPGTCDITLECEVIKEVEEFVYLGGVISSTSSSQPDIRLAGVAVRRLNSIWKNMAISKSTKVRLYETLVLSILCYNSETWTLTAETNRQLIVSEMGCLRRILGVTCRDHISNSDIKAKLKLEDDIVQKISKPADSDILAMWPG